MADFIGHFAGLCPYKDLYLSCASPNQAALSALAEMNLPVLSEHYRELLEKHITLEEVELAKAFFAPRKSLCLDGLPSELYGTLREGTKVADLTTYCDGEN